MKSTAVAPSNIAFIKYWGKANDELRLPLNDSISMNCSALQTTTTVEFSRNYTHDGVEFIGETINQAETDRVLGAIDKVRERARVQVPVRVATKNTFPKGTGAASSASGFAALILAASRAIGLQLPEQELSILARQCSGSACRSIPDGFVMWKKGTSSETSYACSLYPSTYWDVSDVMVVVSSEKKKTSSTDGHAHVTTSPYWNVRLTEIPGRVQRVLTALRTKNFVLLGETMEEECLSMHRVMQTQIPPLYYWIDTTRKFMSLVKDWRKDGLPVYFTIDAGPNVHLICEKPTVQALQKKLVEVEEVKSIFVNDSAPGAHLIEDHLF